MHKALRTLKKLYDEGDAAFVANAGILIKPLTAKLLSENRKASWIPPGVHAHNSAS